MKIVETDLDQSTQSKINRLDDVAKSTEEVSVVYDGSKFYGKSLTSDFLSRKIFSNDDIKSLEKHLYKTEDNYVSAFDTPMISTPLQGAPGLSCNLAATSLFTNSNKILKFKLYEKYYLFLDSFGMLYRISRTKTSVKDYIDAKGLISATYVSTNFEVSNITDILMADSGAYISTDKYGIFFISWDSQTSERVINETDVAKMEFLDGNRLLIIKNSFGNNIIIYDLKTYKKIATFSEMGKYFQTAIDDCVFSKGFAILGRQYAPLLAENYLHVFELDSSATSYVNKDGSVPAFSIADGFLPKAVRYFDSKFYVIGVRAGKIVIRTYYDGETGTSSEKELSDIATSMDDIKDVYVNYDGLTIALGNKILILDSNLDISRIFILAQNIGRIVLIDSDSYYCIDSGECFKYLALGAEEADSVNFVVGNSSKCNNIDILVECSGKNAAVSLINQDKSQSFTPYAYIKSGNLHILKILNCTLDSFIVKIENADSITGLVIHSNELYTR